MTSKFELSIISAESKVFEGEVESVLVPGMIGDFLVLSNHAPCISSIRPGFLEFSEGTSNKQRYFVSGGIIEVINNMVSVLVDSAILGEKIVKEDITTHRGKSCKNQDDYPSKIIQDNEIYILMNLLKFN